MGVQDARIFENDAARDFVARLRAAEPSAVGDLISGAVRKVAQAEGSLEVQDAAQALAALALLLFPYDDEVLTGAPDAQELGEWFAGLEIELNPARRQLGHQAVNRILLPLDNKWFDRVRADSDVGVGVGVGVDDRADAERAVLGRVHRLADLLADGDVED